MRGYYERGPGGNYVLDSDGNRIAAYRTPGFFRTPFGFRATPETMTDVRVKFALRSAVVVLAVVIVVAIAFAIV